MSPEQHDAFAALGEFFVLAPADAPGSWRPLAELVDGPGLGERVEVTRAALERSTGDPVDARVAASTASLGLFARLLSPAVAATLLDVEGPDPARLQWRHVATGTLPLRSPGTTNEPLDVMLADVIEPLAARLTREHRLAETIVRGNAASALVGALRLVARARPAVAHRAEDLATSLLGEGFLAGTALPGASFVRQSCCLYYRLPGGGYCGDCVLAPQHRARARGR